MANEEFVNIRLAEFEYVEKSTKHILEEIEFADEDEKLLCKDIIEHLETTAAEEILNDKCVQIPYIGCLRKNPLRKTLIKHRDNFRLARKILNKEDAKQHIISVFQERKEELKKEDYFKAKKRELTRRFKKKYEQYFTLIGPAYANMFIVSRMRFSIVAYDEEFEQKLKELSNG